VRQTALSILLLAASGSCAVFAQDNPTGESKDPPAPRTHTLQRGETLSLLARQYAVSVHAIVLANNLSNEDRVHIGQRLVIPASLSRPDTPRIPAPPSRRARPRGNLSLTFTDMDVRDALNQIAQYAHTDILLTPGATGPVSINLRSRLPDEAIRLTAAAAGLMVVRVNDVYVVGPPAEVQKAVAEFGRTVVVPLQYVAPAEAADVLARVVPTIRVEASKSAVILSGLPADLEAARTALVELDVKSAAGPAAAPETNVATLHFADPVRTAQVLQEAIPDLKVTRQDQTLILTGNPADLQTAARAVQALDAEPPKVSEAQDILVYHLRFLNAARTVESLKQALPDLTIAAAPEANAPTPAVFNPLSTGLLGGSSSGGSSSGGGLGGGGGGSSTTGGGGATGGSGGAGGGYQPLSRATRLILIGPKSQVETARKLLEQTDLPQPLVRIEALIVEINSEAFKSLGATWDFTNTGFTFAIPNGTGLNFGQVQRFGPDPTNTATPASFTASLQALVTHNMGRILSRPNISVLDNEDASIFIGDLRRFPGETTVSPGVGTVQSIDTIPVGIALLVRPRIHPDGEVTLKVHPVVSTVSSIVNNLPQTSSREADTTVRLHEGEELVIGGLDSSSTTTSEQRVPLLGDLPIIGELFRTRTRDTLKTEIVVVIRVYPVLTDTAPPHDFRPGKE
jgi:type II secretory pathway component GspD/PulD (secretin)